MLTLLVLVSELYLYENFFNETHVNGIKTKRCVANKSKINLRSRHYIMASSSSRNFSRNGSLGILSFKGRGIVRVRPPPAEFTIYRQQRNNDDVDDDFDRQETCGVTSPSGTGVADHDTGPKWPDNRILEDVISMKDRPQRYVCRLQIFKKSHHTQSHVRYGSGFLVKHTQG